MLTASTWWILLIVQLIIFLVAGIAALTWVLWRRSGTPPVEVAPPGPSERADEAIRRFFENELTRTRAQLEENDRGLPEHVLQLRVNYLQAELEGLDHEGQPDRFWSHICDRIDHWIARQQERTDAERDSGADAARGARGSEDIIADDEYVR
ncbi:hypothetical protein [Aquisalimonas asiatica]|uniref:Uncharacterized protein n=1 Tax=Aquisalimonas asiatica TaxID=406100 RepID=A0A1H8VQE9_9GAMM|nr:hypothetical protein [Aquisalimonas asiatica]SEP17457.1 hypothetical protein SAMN04488052_11436 [Aquisalimonas asiatica]